MMSARPKDGTRLAFSVVKATAFCNMLGTAVFSQSISPSATDCTDSVSSGGTRVHSWKEISSS